jgi:hypothetical protein
LRGKSGPNSRLAIRAVRNADPGRTVLTEIGHPSPKMTHSEDEQLIIRSYPPFAGGCVLFLTQSGTGENAQDTGTRAR